MPSHTLKSWLIQAIQVLKEAGVPSPEVDAKALARHALHFSGADLLLQANTLLDAESRAKLEALLAQRVARIPLQYLLGQVEWADLHLKVDRRALIPRPETEWLLYLALQRLKSLPSPAVLDVGTGTGALALGIKQAKPQATVIATDISADALALAAENAVLNGLQVEFIKADLLSGLVGPFDLIVSNPPYLPQTDKNSTQPEVNHDPELALYSGKDGLELARKLVKQAETRLSAGGWLLLELDPRNATQLATEMNEQGWQTMLKTDLVGRERFIEAQQVR